MPVSGQPVAARHDPAQFHPAAGDPGSAGSHPPQAATDWGRDATSERNRVQKVLEEASIKLGSVLSDIFGVSGQLMLEKLLEGDPDLEAIANLAQRQARAKIPEILQALEGHRLRDRHRRMLRLSFQHRALLEEQIGAIDGEVRQLIEREGYRKSFDLLQSIPGVQELSAAALLAEAGADRERVSE